MKAMIPALLLAALAACTYGPEPQAQLDPREQKELAKALEGKVAGKPVTCIQPHGGANLHAVGERTLLYRMSGKLVYRNDVVGSCYGLRMGDTLVLEMHGSQYCRGDIARVVDLHTGMMSGSCVLGDFTPYEAPDKG